MDLQIKDKVYIVTGGSKGIGRAIVELLAEESAIPVIVNRKGKEGKELLSTLKNNGKEALYIEGELSEVSFCKSLVEEVMQAYGRIDGLVNNAGKNDGVGLVGGTPDQFVESFHNNLFHYYNLAHYAIHAII
ncbi:MAG: SDR family NAD(P)-dependent oxidoreductase, partial [Cyclobacteriaceae bacterium]|nr:SDR family NAD(P)-dependent oxidoreductase [Cyclobacteriaceae bacterium]